MIVFRSELNVRNWLNEILIIFVDRNTTDYFSMLAYFFVSVRIFAYLHIRILIFVIFIVDINHGIIYIYKFSSIAPMCKSKQDIINAYKIMRIQQN